MALGVAQLKEDIGAEINRNRSSSSSDVESMPEIHQFLDRFYMSRIGIRMLIGQHISLHAPKEEQIGGRPNEKTGAQHTYHAASILPRYGTKA